MIAKAEVIVRLATIAALADRAREETAAPIAAHDDSSAEQVIPLKRQRRNSFVAFFPARAGIFVQCGNRELKQSIKHKPTGIQLVGYGEVDAGCLAFSQSSGERLGRPVFNLEVWHTTEVF
jgi:hypothetical protein